jgi:hypothetical protein
VRMVRSKLPVMERRASRIFSRKLIKLQRKQVAQMPEA